MKYRHALGLVFTLAVAWGTAAMLPAQAQIIEKPAVSNADTIKAYRMDAARHVYAIYSHKIYKGKLPPLVHAIVVTEVELDAGGHVRDIRMIRVPRHAPEVTVAVRNMIRGASPMPAPARLGGIRFTEIWLVDKSGRFQLDALTEGQL
jgi:hypothetical protein